MRENISKSNFLSEYFIDFKMDSGTLAVSVWRYFPLNYLVSTGIKNQNMQK